MSETLIIQILFISVLLSIPIKVLELKYKVSFIPHSSVPIHSPSSLSGHSAGLCCGMARRSRSLCQPIHSHRSCITSLILEINPHSLPNPNDLRYHSQHRPLSLLKTNLANFVFSSSISGCLWFIDRDRVLLDFGRVTTH